MKAGVTNRIKVFLCSVGIFGGDLMVNPTQQIVAGRDCPSSLSKRWIAGQQCFCMCMSPYEPLCTTSLNWINIINRRTLSFSRCAFSAVMQCIVVLYCVLFPRYLGQITKMTHQPATPHGFLLAMANHCSRPDFTADFCVLSTKEILTSPENHGECDRAKCVSF